MDLASDLAARLAPFIVWLASRERDEQVRRRHRRLVEQYLVWCGSDCGPAHDRRARFEYELARHPHSRPEFVTAALDRFAEYHTILRLTRTVDA